MRSSRRLYSDAAVESWFLKLDTDWERFFSEQELNAGRKFYRTGGILEIELSHTDAVIHTKVDDLPVYSVVDWSAIKPDVRYSHEDVEMGREIAIAGLYEVEELVAEEASPIAFEREVQKSEENEPEPEKEEAVEEVSAQFDFILSFFLHKGNLAFSPFWVLENGKRVPAIGAESLDSDEVGVADREQLIRLMSLAKRADFKFSNDDNCYVLDEVSSIPLFFSKDWRTWKSLFKVQADPQVRLMFKGNRMLETSATVKKSKQGIQVEWNILSDGSMLSQSEVRTVLKAEGAMRFLPDRGLVTLASTDTDSIREWQERLDHEFSDKVPPYMLFSFFQQEFKNLEVTEDLQKWRDEFFQTPEKRSGEPELLRDYQRTGVRWMGHIFDNGAHALLADEMGLGKTLQVLSLFHVRPIPDKPYLVICPASVVPVWLHEAARFFPEMKLRIVGKSDDFVRTPGPYIWLSSYTQIRRHKHLLSEVDFAYCVLDEAQFIKNPAAKVTQACMSIQAEHRIVLTGTPIENNYRDLWTLFRFLLPGLLGSKSRFEDKLAKDEATFSAKLKRQIAPFLLRRLKTDVADDLPAKTEVELMCPMTEYQKHQYDQLVRGGIDKFSDAWTKGSGRESMNILTLFTRLRQVSCDPALLPGNDSDIEQSGKLTVLRDRMGELIESGHRVVVFSQFVKLLNRVKKMLKTSFPGISLYELTGKTRDRSKPVDAFQNSEKGAVMLLSLKAGGTGITLHAADYVFLLDPWWNPAVEAQAIDRVHRIGQTQKVFVYRLVSQGSIEEKIQQLKAQKLDIFQQVIEDSPKLNELKDIYGSLEDLLRS